MLVICCRTPVCCKIGARLRPEWIPTGFLPKKKHLFLQIWALISDFLAPCRAPSPPVLSQTPATQVICLWCVSKWVYMFMVIICYNLCICLYAGWKTSWTNRISQARSTDMAMVQTMEICRVWDKTAGFFGCYHRFWSILISPCRGWKQNWGTKGTHVFVTIHFTWA